MAKNQIETLTPAFFSKMEGVEVLNLGGNRISQIQQDTFTNLGKLSALRLDQNQVQCTNNKELFGVNKIYLEDKVSFS